MFLYFLLVAFPLAVGLVGPSRPRQQYVGLWFYFVVLVLICGLRFEVGPDWESYVSIYDNFSAKEFADAFDSSEPGYLLLNLLASWTGVGFAGVVLVGSLVFLYGCFAYARTTANAWLALAAITPYLVLVISMSGIRQSIAIGIGFLVLSKWNRSSTVVKIAWIGLAVTFHNSAVALMVFVLMDMQRSLFLRVALSAAPVAFLLYGLDSDASLDRYRSVYIEENLVSEGAFFHLLLTVFPAVLYLRYEKKLVQARVDNRNVRLAAVMAVCAVPLLAISSTGTDRLTLYLSFVQMWTYPALLSARAMNRATLKLGTAVVILLIFFVYFFFGSHAFAYLPYKNVLFG